MKILIAGDFVPQGETARLIDEGNYEAVFGEIPPITAKADYSIVNLEAPVINGEPTPIRKSGPNLHCSNKALDAVRYAGFDCVSLANNHFYDQGEQGVNDTINECKTRNIEYVGGGYNLADASNILYKEFNGETLAIINCCKKEFSIADDTHGGSNPMEPVRIYYSIKEAKNKADYVLVITHGGIEHYQYPYPQMQELYRFFIDAGADAVVNHHQHCPSGYEVYHDKPIIYGLGNFCFNWLNRDENWYKGHVVMLSLRHEGIGFELFPYEQSKNSAAVSFFQIEDKNAYLMSLNELSSVITDSKLVDSLYDEYIGKTLKSYVLRFENRNNNIKAILQDKKLYPLSISIKQLYTILNVTRCQAHRNNMIVGLGKYLAMEEKLFKHRRDEQQ